MLTIVFTIFKIIFLSILLQCHKSCFCYRQRAKDLEDELERTIRSYQNQVCLCVTWHWCQVGMDVNATEIPLSIRLLYWIWLVLLFCFSLCLFFYYLFYVICFSWTYCLFVDLLSLTSLKNKFSLSLHVS